MRIAHISDPHFFLLNTSLSQFFSKRWLGNLNLLLNRKGELFIDRLHLLPLFFKSKEVTDVVISGDLTTTSDPREFKKAQAFVKLFEDEGMRVLLIPGNHDHYTKKACNKKVFYDFFPSLYPPQKSAHPNLKDDRHTVISLQDNWAMVLVDTSLASNLFNSTGKFSSKLEQSLRKTLSLLENKHVIMVNHFPFMPIEKPKKRLIGSKHLINLIRDFPNIRMYWHGHTHRKIIADLRESSLPVVLDPASISYKLGSFFISDIEGDNLHLKSYHWVKSHWVIEEDQTFSW